nr:phosphohydrolase [Deinococcus humi]
MTALDSRGVLTPALALAAWGHDLVYDATAGDNEDRSAEVFDGWLASRQASTELRQEVRELILATKHVAPPASRAEALMVDADLAILGASAAEFDAYDTAIRQEYAHVPSSIYRTGRQKVLRGFLNRERIYTTPEFVELEWQARVNLVRVVGLQ